MFLLDEDIVTVICFSKNQQLGRESLNFFMELLKRQNPMFIDGLRRLNFEFSELLPLLSSTDFHIVFAVLELFVHLVSVKLLGQYTAAELLTTMLLLCNPRSFRLEFAEKLLKFILPFGVVVERSAIPFFLLSLLYISSTESGRLLIPFYRAMQKSPNVFPQFHRYFILFLIHIHLNSDDIGFVKNSMRIVGSLVILSPAADPLAGFVRFVESVSPKLELDLSSFLRLFLMEIVALSHSGWEI
jgi:hypothetical protein